MSADLLFRLNVLATITRASDLAEGKSDLTYAKELHYTNGTGLNQLSNVWHDQRLLASGVSEELDLNGPLTDVLGQAMLFTRVKLLVVYAQPTNTTVITVGGAASGQFATWVGGAAHTVLVRPGGWLALAAPDATAYVVTDSTGDKLKIANSAGADGRYDIIVAGTM